MSGATTQIPIIETDIDEGYERDFRDIANNVLIILSLPCPGRRIYSGGVGGAAMTDCTLCGETMASTAGPHSVDGRFHKPVIAYGSGNGIVSWRPFYNQDGEMG